MKKRAPVRSPRASARGTDPRPKGRGLRTEGTDPRPEGRGLRTSVYVALIILTIAVYAQVASFGFVDLDDTGYVVTNPHVTTGLTADNVRWALTSTYAANWHPLTWMSHQLDVSLFGLNAGRHHLTNLLWHIVATLLLFGCLRTMTGALWRSAFVAAAFAVHPAHVESVAWIAERKDVLSAALWFATTWAYVAWTRRPGPGRYLLVLGCFALGLMAKPMLVTLPFTLLLLDYWPLARSSSEWKRRVSEKMPLFVLAAISSIITTIAQSTGGAVGSFEVAPLADRLLNAALSYGRYLAMLVWPSHLAVLYPYHRPAQMAAALVWLSVLVTISIIAWRRRRRYPPVIVGWLWFIGTLVPVIGFVQVGSQAMADRYTYVPFVGLLIAIAWGAIALADRMRVPRRVIGGIGAGIILLFAIGAYRQAAVWASTESLWRHAVTELPDSARAHNSLGVALGNSGRVAEATEQFHIAAGLQLDVATARDLFPNLGRSLLSQGKVAEALPYLERAREVSPERAIVWHQLGIAYASVHRTDEAIAAWRQAVRLDPAFEEAYFTMGLVFASQHRTQEAKDAFTNVLRINPSRKDAREMLASLGGK
jgi:Flp pilus assembly protein TadD